MDDELRAELMSVPFYQGLNKGCLLYTSNKILEKQLTNKILIQQWIEKWNGEVPKVSGDSKSMINIQDLLN